MHPSPTENFISTKDASAVSGYNPDYLGRLARSGKIVGKIVDRSWFIDSASLATFLQEQKNRKLDQIRLLKQERVEEYQKHQQPSSAVKSELTAISPVSEVQLAPLTFQAQALAFSIASFVVISSLVITRAPFLPHLREQGEALAAQTALGFDETFGDIPVHIATNIGEVQATMHAYPALVAVQNSLASSDVASPMLEKPDFSSLRLVIPASHTAFVAASIVASHSYRDTSLAAYRTCIDEMGAGAVASAIATRDALATTPQLAVAMDTAFGQAVVAATHALIGADVAIAYGLAAIAPASARVTVMTIGTTGALLAEATAQIPSLATNAYLQITAAPAYLAPALAQAVFDAEYRGALHFVAFTDTILTQYGELTDATGKAVYNGVAGTQAFAAVIVAVPKSL
jgi:hypothetical protein